MKRKQLLVNITVLRGAFALALGGLLILQPENTRTFAIIFMGVYWLLGGIVNLRVARATPRAKGLRYAVGVIGIVAGVALLSRSYAIPVVPVSTPISIIGLLITLSSILHILAGLRFSEVTGRGWKVTDVLLGVFEVVLGVKVLLLPWIRLELAYLSVAAWALLGGLIMLGDGFRLRQPLLPQD